MAAGIAFRPLGGAGQAAGIAFRHARSAGADCQTRSPTALPTAAPGSTAPTAVPSASPSSLAPTTTAPSAADLALGGGDEKESVDITSLILIGVAIAVVSGGMVALLTRRQRKPEQSGDRHGTVLTGNPVFPAGGVGHPTAAQPRPAARPEDQYDVYERTYAEPADPHAYEVPQIYKNVDGSPVYEEAGPGSGPDPRTTPPPRAPPSTASSRAAPKIKVSLSVPCCGLQYIPAIRCAVRFHQSFSGVGAESQRALARSREGW